MSIEENNISDFDWNSFENHVDDWNSFVNFVVSNERPDWLPSDYEMSEDLLDVLRQEITGGLERNQLDMHFEIFKNFKESPNDLSTIESVTSDFSESSDLDDFDLGKLETTFAEASLLDQMGSSEGLDFEEKPSFTDLDLDTDFEQNLELPTDLEMENLRVPLSESDEDSQIQEAIIEKDIEDIEDIVEEVEQKHLDEERLKNQAAAMEQPTMGYGPASSGQRQGGNTLSALSSMVSSLARGSAHIAGSFESAAAAGATWGAEKYKSIAEKVGKGSSHVNDSIEAMSQMNVIQAQEHTASLRGNSLSANIGNIAEVMTDAREVMQDLAEAQNSSLSLLQMNEQAKQSSESSPEISNHWREQIKEALLEKGLDVFMDDVNAVANANSLVDKYLSNVDVISSRLGEDIGSHLSDELNAYSEELQDSHSVLEDLVQIAEQSGILDQEQKDQMEGIMEKLKDSIAQLSDRLSSMFGKAAKAGITQGM